MSNKKSKENYVIKSIYNVVIGQLNVVKVIKKNLPMRTSYQSKVFKKELYNEKVVELYAGQALLFQNSLMHRGDLNVSKKKVRYAATCFYHDVKLLNRKLKQHQNLSVFHEKFHKGIMELIDL